MRTKPMLGALLAAALAGPAAGQLIPDASESYVVMLQPVEWTELGVRGKTGIVRGRAVRVEGRAYHASGIRQVSINGTPVSLRRDEDSGATRFSGRLSAAELERDVEIVAYPSEGEPIARIHSPDGSVRYGALSEVRPSVAPLAAEEVSSALRVSLQALPESARPVVAASFTGTPGVVEAAPGTQAHLTIAGGGSEWLVLGRDGSVRHRVGATTAADGAAALRYVLEQERGALQLETLAPPRETFPLELGMPNGQTRFRVDDWIRFEARSGGQGYFTLLDLGTDGTITVLYPLEGDAPHLPPGQLVTVPDPEAREPLMAAEPFGRGVVRAFVTPRPLGLTGNTVPAETVLRALRAATTDPATGRPLPWATALLEYHIVP
ncbi:MAG TPA: DUF4384 domain-containing protein [Longimicrobium sp.]|nr:DUF4384 domain-containing protein [Longimicrobium sp.]